LALTVPDLGTTPTGATYDRSDLRAIPAIGFGAVKGRIGGTHQFFGNQVSETMRSGLRPSDFLGRWTDDQFLAILMDCGVAGMEEAGARMRKVVGCAGLQWWRDELSATISLGYSAAQTGDTMESLLERAQRSLEEKSASCVLAASAGNQGRSKS
jgi:GGDEF domain-containing protein